MNAFFEIKPLDTLFFKGSVPMEAGQYNAISMFPPPVSVLRGAFWTAFCKKKQQEYSDGLINNEIPFGVSAIFVKKGGYIYAPAPATWYYDSEEKVRSGIELDGINLCIADIEEELETFSAKSSAFENGIVFAASKIDAKTLASCWINIEFLNNPKEKFGKTDVLFPGDIYSFENRTGNGLSETKVAKDGALYSSTHLRFLSDVSLIVEIDKDIELDKGVFQLGGEQRIACYEKYPKTVPEIKLGDGYLSLIPVEATEDNLKHLIASGKLCVTAGWDLAAGFHKESKTWIPAGAIFNKIIK